MKTKYLVGLGLLGVGAVVVACSSDPPTLDGMAVNEISDSDEAGLTFVRSEADPQVTYADPTKGVYLGNGLSFILYTQRFIGNPPDEQSDKDRLFNTAFTMGVQGDCVTTSVTNNSDNVVFNTVHDGDCQVTFTVNGLHNAVVVPVHVVDQGTVPKNVYPPDLPPPVDEAGTDAGTGTTTTDTDAGDTSDAGDGGTGIAPVGG